jgi:hypothetical protein
LFLLYSLNKLETSMRPTNSMNSITRRLGSFRLGSSRLMQTSRFSTRPNPSLSRCFQSPKKRVIFLETSKQDNQDDQGNQVEQNKQATLFLGSFNNVCASDLPLRVKGFNMHKGRVLNKLKDNKTMVMKLSRYPHWPFFDTFRVYTLPTSNILRDSQLFSQEELKSIEKINFGELNRDKLMLEVDNFSVSLGQDLSPESKILDLKFRPSTLGENREMDLYCRVLDIGFTSFTSLVCLAFGYYLGSLFFVNKQPTFACET